MKRQALKKFTILSLSLILLAILLAAASLSQAQNHCSAAAFYNRGNERCKRIKTTGPLNTVTQRALTYFQQVNEQRFDDYLRRVRPEALSSELRERVLNMLPKTDLVSPSPEGVAKLGTLDPILRYHQRQSIVEFKVLRSPTATAVFLAGAAVLITEPALNILTAEELQAVVAHELAHEYFWSRFELALNNHMYPELQQLELRCDGIAVVTLLHVDVNPERLISAIRKLDQHNRRQGPPSSMNYVDFSERSTFIRLIADLVRGRSVTPIFQAQTPRSAAMYYNRGNERYKKGDMDGAIADFDAALIFDPKLSRAYIMRGSARYSKGDLTGSVADYTRAIEIDPLLALAYYNRGKARRDQGDLQGSIADYTRALEINPRLSSAYNNRGNARREKGELDGALSDLNKAVRFDPQNALVYNNRGLTRRAKGDLQGAITDYDRAIKINPRFVEAYSNRGNARQDKGDVDGSIDDYELALKIDPFYAKAYGNRGLARLYQGDKVRAAKDFDQCLRLDSTLKPLLEEQIERVKQRLAARP